jgi:hypothetical protein
MRRIALALLPIAVLAACASNEKLGDRAAATGDWKSAEAQYGAALQKDPNNPEKRAKWQQARQAALAGAVAANRACQVAQDWECAFGEADYLARLEPGSAEYAALRADAGRNVAYLRLRRASEASQRRDHRAAFDLLAQARAATNDPAAQAEASRLSASLVQGAVQDAMTFRGQQQYPQAVDLLTLAASVDGGVRPTLDQVRGEYDRWLDAQYEAAAQEGDGLLRERRFAEAQARYEAALQLKKGGRAEPLARYARGLAHGDAAVQRRDWPAATRAYQEAVQSGMDGRGGYAATQLDRVRIRPYAIRLRSVLVKPIRPDGAPWAGGRSRGYDRVVGLLANAALDRGGSGIVAGLDLYDALPHDNRPNVIATLTLPDGRQFVTPAQKAIRARFESSVVVATNAFDDRPISIRIAHQDAGGTFEIGAVTVRLTDLLDGGEVGLSDRAVVQVKLAAEVSPLQDGATQGFAPLTLPPQPAPAPAPAPPRTSPPPPRR